MQKYPLPIMAEDEQSVTFFSIVSTHFLRGWLYLILSLTLRTSCWGKKKKKRSCMIMLKRLKNLTGSDKSSSPPNGKDNHQSLKTTELPKSHSFTRQLIKDNWSIIYRQHYTFKKPNNPTHVSVQTLLCEHLEDWLLCMNGEMQNTFLF